MPKYDAVVVFGTRLQQNGTFLPIVYQEIDRAIKILKQSAAKQFIFCGSHWIKDGLRGPKECDVAEKYVGEKYPECLKQFKKEGRSTTVPENWLFLKLDFPEARRLHQVTLTPLLPRMQFFGDWIFGDEGELSFETLTCPESLYPQERRVFRDAKCILTVYNKMKRGDHKFLLKNGKSRWKQLPDDHHNCQRCYG